MMQALRTLRKQRGLTMKQLGEAVGAAESTISQYETGKRKPDYKTLIKLAEYLGVSTDYLLRGEEGAAPSDADIKFALFGDRETDDALLEEVKAFARFAKERKENGKTGGTV